MTLFEQIKRTMQGGSKKEKISIIESISGITDPKALEIMISGLDDEDVEIRGEVFSALLLNENDISSVLLQGLKSQNKNIRGYCALVLANRNEKNSISSIVQLTEDQNAMVRSCAVGALGYLRAVEASFAIQKCLDDSNAEVVKSAIKSAIDIKDRSLISRLDMFAKQDDPEIKKLVVFARNNL